MEMTSGKISGRCAPRNVNGDIFLGAEGDHWETSPGRECGHFKGDPRRRRATLRRSVGAYAQGFQGESSKIPAKAHGRLSLRYRLDVPHLPKRSDWNCTLKFENLRYIRLELLFF